MFGITKEQIQENSGSKELEIPESKDDGEDKVEKEKEISKEQKDWLWRSRPKDKHSHKIIVYENSGKHICYNSQSVYKKDNIIIVFIQNYWILLMFGIW